MRLKYSFILLLLLLPALAVQAQRKPRIKGNRMVTEVREELPEFSVVSLQDDLEIVLERAPGPGYAITADDNLIDILKFEVSSDTLFISSFYTVTAKKELDIRILYTELSGINLFAGSLLAREAVQADILQVKAGEMARLRVDARASVIDLQLQGQSKSEFNLEADSLHVVLSDRADARIYLQGGKLAIKMGDESDALLEGMASNLDLQMDSGADLKAERLLATTVTAHVRGTVQAHLQATDLIELSSGGSANTYLYGEPRISILEFSGTSELYKRTE